MSVPSFANFPDVGDELSEASTSHKEVRRHRKRKERTKLERHGSPGILYGPQTGGAHDRQSRLFFLDRKGDPLNVTFGGIAARSVPKYHRAPGILGLRSRQAEPEFRYEDRYIFRRNLARSAKRLVTSDSNAYSPTLDYISLSLKGVRDDSETGLRWEAGSSSLESSRSPSPETQWRSPFAHLEARIRADPLDLSAWRALIYKSSLASPETKSATQVKLAVVERALTHLPDCPVLLTQHARLSSLLLPVEEAEGIWESALLRGKGHGRKDLWMEWLAWVFKTKGVDEGLRSTPRATNTFGGDLAAVDFLGLMSAILFRSGYTEKAISIYQALLEGHCRARGDSINTSWSAVLKQVEANWDKEAPRLGESGYLTTKFVVGQQSSALAVAPTLQTPLHDGPFSAWASLEAQASLEVLPPPAGTVDDTDPYRTTLFQDIRLFLPNQLLSLEAFSLAAFDLLALLGIGPSTRLGVEVGALRAPRDWLYMWERPRGDFRPAEIAFIRNVFIQLRPYFEADALDRWNEMDLAFEFAVSRKGAAKHAKHLLSSSPSSTYLWSLYAEVEASLGNPNTARRVYGTVTRQPTSDNKQMERLWYKWAALEWKLGAGDAAVTIICEGVLNGEGHRTIRILKAKQELSSRLAERPTSWQLKSLALLTYLTSDLADTLSALQLRSDASEALHVARAEFLVELMGNRGAAAVPSAALRDFLEESARIYPLQPLILWAFATNESHERIWGRLHRLFEALLEQMGGCQSLEFWSAAVLSATSVHEKREWLDRAVQDERLRSSASIWRCYIDTELGSGRVKEAKALLYRAVLECPWSKDLHLLAFSDALRGSFTARELSSWIDLMVERNLRLRIEWDGVTEEAESSEDGTENPALDEVEKAAEERRRRMPY